MQALTVELLNERKYSAILDDLNRFQEVWKLVTPWNLKSILIQQCSCLPHASKVTIVKEERSFHLGTPASTRSNKPSVLTCQDMVCRHARL